MKSHLFEGRVRVDYTYQDHIMYFTVYEDLYLGHPEMTLRGSIEWDGCANWKTNDTYHFCGLHSVAFLGRLFTFLYTLAEDIPDADVSLFDLRRQGK